MVPSFHDVHNTRQVAGLEIKKKCPDGTGPRIKCNESDRQINQTEGCRIQTEKTEH